MDEQTLLYVLLGLAGAVGIPYLLRNVRPGSPDETEEFSGPTPADVGRWGPTVRQIAREINFPFDPDLALAVVWQESAGKVGVKGSAGETGLMQLTPIAVEDVRQQFPRSGGDLPDEPTGGDNLRAGMLYLKLQARRTGNDRFDTLRAYNEGPPPLTEPASRRYADEVEEKLEVVRN